MPSSPRAGPRGVPTPKGPGRHLPQIWSSGAAASGPVPLPQVVTVGSSIQTTAAGSQVFSATLIGSINTFGQAGTWWFNYGTSPMLGTTTTTTAASASVMPQTVSTVLTSVQLVPGATYYFALVGSTVGGTVTGNTLSFVFSPPASPVSPTTAVTSTKTSSVAIPHLAWPFKLVYGTDHTALNQSNDGVRVVDQDSDGDIYACVSSILACEIGQWPEVPSFGIHDQAFDLAVEGSDGKPQIDTLGIASTISRWEPRASSSIISLSSTGDPADGNFTISAEVA